MTTRYAIDPGQGRFTVQAFATGMLSMLGHSPTFAVGDFAGVVRLDGGPVEGLGVEVTVRAESLTLLDQVSANDRGEIEGRMRRDVLETSAFPEILYQTVETAADPLGDGRFKVFLGGRLTLHGVTQPLGIEGELMIDGDRLRLRGGCMLRLSAYRIRPVRALAGAIQLKDELKVAFDLVARPLPEGP